MPLPRTESVERENTLFERTALEHAVVLKMLFANSAPARSAPEDQQTAEIGIGQMERMRGIFFPVFRRRTAVLARDIGRIGIGEIPVVLELLKRRQRFGTLQGIIPSGYPPLRRQNIFFDGFPQRQGQLHRRCRTRFVNNIVNMDFFAGHAPLPSASRKRPRLNH